MAAAKKIYHCTTKSEGYGGLFCGRGDTLEKAYKELCETVDSHGDAKPSVDECNFFEVTKINVEAEESVTIRKV